GAGERDPDGASVARPAVRGGTVRLRRPPVRGRPPRPLVPGCLVAPGRGQGRPRASIRVGRLGPCPRAPRPPPHRGPPPLLDPVRLRPRRAGGRGRDRARLPPPARAFARRAGGGAGVRTGAPAGQTGYFHEVAF